MEHDDDPERRIAELERRQGWASSSRPVGQPGAYPPPPQAGWGAPAPNSAPPHAAWPHAPGWTPQRQAGHTAADPSGYGSPTTGRAPWPVMSAPRKTTFGTRYNIVSRIVAAAVLWVFLVGVAGFLGYQAYGYMVGTPTVASVDSCTKRKKNNVDCYGTWSIDGTRQSGPIEGPGRSDVGSKVAARVHDGTAYTQDSVVFSSLMGAALAGVAFVVYPIGGVWLYRKRRRFL